jgi:hypothetical protein
VNTFHARKRLCMFHFLNTLCVNYYMSYTYIRSVVVANWLVGKESLNSEG